MKNSFFALLLLFSLGFVSSCGGDDDGGIGPNNCVADVYSNRVTAALNTLSTAVTNYSTDQSASNCNAYKSALNGYLDVLTEFESCAFVDAAELRMNIAEAREDIDDLTC